MKPDSLEILYEDPYMLVCAKPRGIPTQTQRIGTPDMVSLLKNYLAQSDAAKGAPYLAVIHRLDQPVRGILVFAKTPEAARALNQQLSGVGFGKYYRALVEGEPAEPQGTLEHYLVKDSHANMSRVCTKEAPGAKLCRLYYQEVKKGQGIFNLGRRIFKNPPSPTELDIHLDTGRHHQIRVQLAAIGCPIIGDSKYNPNGLYRSEQLLLCAYRLELRHPVSGEPLCFEIAEEGTGDF